MSECRFVNITFGYMPKTLTSREASVIRIILFDDEVYRLPRAMRPRSTHVAVETRGPLP